MDLHQVRPAAHKIKIHTATLRQKLRCDNLVVLICPLPGLRAAIYCEERLHPLHCHARQKKGL